MKSNVLQKIIGIVVGCSVAFVVCAETPNTFMQANALYDQKEYGKALALYMRIPEKDFAIWYNLGNCAYKMGAYQKAYIYWKRAEKCAMKRQQDTLVQHNLAQLPEYVFKQDSLLQKVCKGLGRTISLGMAQVLFLITWFLLLYALVKKRSKKLLLSLSLLNCTLALVGALKYYNQTLKWGVVQTKTSVYAGPDKRYHVVGTIDNLTELIIKKTHAPWYKVVQGSIRGWVPGHTVELL